MVKAVTFQPTFQDLRALTRAKASLGRLGRFGWVGRYVLFGAIFPVVAAAVFAWNSNGHALDFFLDLDLLWIAPTFLVAIWALMASIDLFFEQVLYRWVFRRQMRATGIAGHPLTVTFGGASVCWSAPGLAGEVSWSKIIRVFASKDHLFLFLSKMGGLTIPRRAFASENDFQALVTYAKERAPA